MVKAIYGAMSHTEAVPCRDTRYRFVYPEQEM